MSASSTGSSTGSVTTAIESLRPGRWTLDPASSQVRFQHKAMWGMVTVKGAFRGVTGQGQILPGGSAHGTLTIDAATLDTGHVKRDAHLRTADFLHTDEHPSIVFTAESATQGPNGRAEVAGALTVRGVTKPFEFNALVTEATPDAVTLTADVAVDRTDHGLTWNKFGMMTGPATISVTARFTHQSS